MFEQFGNEMGDLNKAIKKAGISFKGRIVSVTGSSGKSLTAHFLYGILSSSGYKTAAYLNCFPVFPSNLLLSYKDCPLFDESLLKIASKCGLSLGQAQFLLSFKAAEDCDFFIIEHDIGGLSSSCYFDDLFSDLTVLTSTGLDHVELLGTTESEIALDCVSLCPVSSRLLSYDLGELTLPPVKEYCEANDVTWTKADLCHYPHLEGDDFVFEYFPYKDLHIPYIGRIAVEDAGLAIEAARILLPDLKEEDVKSGLAIGPLPYHLSKKGDVYFDLASSPEQAYGLSRSAQTLAKNGPVSVIYGARKGSNVSAILPILDNAFAQVFLSTVPGDSAYWDEDDFALFVADHPFVSDIKSHIASHPGTYLIVGEKGFVFHAEKEIG